MQMKALTLSGDRLDKCFVTNDLNRAIHDVSREKYAHWLAKKQSSSIIIGLEIMVFKVSGALNLCK